MDAETQQQVGEDVLAGRAVEWVERVELRTATLLTPEPNEPLVKILWHNFDAHCARHPDRDFRHFEALRLSDVGEPAHDDKNIYIHTYAWRAYSYPKTEVGDFEARLRESMTPEAWAEIEGSIVTPTYRADFPAPINGVRGDFMVCSTCGVWIWSVVQQERHTAWHRRITLSIKAQGYIITQILKALEVEG